IEILLLYDSWAGQVDDQIYSNVQCHRLKIPAKTTSLIQPLDKVIFRQYKVFRMKISDRCLLDSVNFDLHSSQDVLYMQSLIYNQLQSPKFYLMLKYAWLACGYTGERVRFQNVIQALFEDNNSKCDEKNCESYCFITCAICNKKLCFHHFVV